MKHVVLSVFDEAAGVFGRPMALVSVATGIRSFTDEVNRASADNAMFNHPSDFKLFHLGEFDDNTGQMVSFQSPELVITALNCKVEAQ